MTTFLTVAVSTLFLLADELTELIPAKLSRIISDMSLELGISNPNQEVFPLPDYIRKFQIKSIDNRLDEVEKQLRTQMPPPQLRELMEKHRGLTAQKRELINPQPQ